MEIKVLGPGCPNCQELEKRVKRALEELNLPAQITKVTDYKDIGKYVMMTPGLVVDEKVVHSGKPLPRVDKIKEWIKAAQAGAGQPTDKKGGCCCCDLSGCCG